MLIVLSLDALSAGALGCYGNDWVGTPAIDALAAESLLFDFALTDVPTVDALRSFWSGNSAAARKRGAAAPADLLPKLWNSAGKHSLLFTDDRSILTFREAAAFDEQISMNAPDEPTIVADLAETHLASFFAQAAEAIAEFSESESPGLIWLHGGSLATCWDAPLEYRHRYRDEDDPPPPDLAEPPATFLPAGEEYDPDELLGLRRAYAGQVAALDELLETFLGFLSEQGLLHEAHFLLLAPRGFGLGEHGLIGFPPEAGTGNALHEEYLHVPWIWRFPDSLAANDRRAAEHLSGLDQPADLLPTVWSLLGLARSTEVSDGVDHALQDDNTDQDRRVLALSLSADGQAAAIRSRAWHLNRPFDEQPADLFAKPDDRWEMNNVADRCPEIVEQLDGLAQQLLEGSLAPAEVELDEVLTAQH